MNKTATIALQRLLSLEERLTQFPARRRNVVLAGVVISVVYLAGVTGRWYPMPDTAVYLGLAKSLAAGEAYRFNGQVSNSYAPGLPLILAGLRMLFGQGYWAANLFVALCGLAALAMIYLSMRELTGEGGISVVVAIAASFSCNFYDYSHRTLSDVPFALLRWCLNYCLLRFCRGGPRWLILAGLLSVLCVLIRAPAIVILSPLAAGLLMDRPLLEGFKRRVAACAAVLIPALAALGCLWWLAYQATPGMPNYVRVVTTKLGPVGYLFRMAQGLQASRYRRA
jgi:4-amino-4-deoxy-L-arabinose transferase-like glycosyltransferase